MNGIPARDGATVYNGDRVSTGENSSAYVYFKVGGFIQLDENTDPSLELIWEQTKCIIRVIGQLIGQSYVETGEQCIKEIKSPHGSWTSETTALNLRVTSQRSILTVLEGRMALVQPRYEVIGAGQQISVSQVGVEWVRRLSPGELRSVVGWQEEFPPPGSQVPYTPPEPPLTWCCVNGQVFEAPREACFERGGRVYGSFEEAQRYCRRPPEPPLTWCCVNGQVFEAPREACFERGGRAYRSPDEAWRYCRQPPPEPAPAWCCANGQVFQAPQEACFERGGKPYRSPEEAERYCRPIEPTPQPAWCCANGQVFQAPQEACFERGGKPYRSPEEAERYCRPIEPPPGIIQRPHIYQEPLRFVEPQNPVIQ